ncbi:Chromosome II, complete genome, related [Eimeria acervulina]|uniref:Chromosome II, complete genome, related n=1 Tax=Eimeria acervulina TaxID=5801 RepID=U6GUM6_EIMAC|nr:Chromosome II, complete genome, related [Eimeria acervulina]CDI82269.1 Chromosome II, complete genome, related [Eimeria acervulina]
MYSNTLNSHSNRTSSSSSIRIAGAAAAGAAAAGSIRGFATESFPKGLHRDLDSGCTDTPVGGENLYRRVGGPGYPMLFDVKYDKPTWQPLWEDEHEVIPRDGFGVPAHIPPEVSTKIKHVVYIPPHYYTFLKRLGEDSPSLQPFMSKLIQGQLTFADYEEMFYKFAKPAKIYRAQIPKPFRTQQEVQQQQQVDWEGAWLSYRQRVLADYQSTVYLREYLFGAMLGIFFGYLWLDQHRQYRLDMKLFYLEAPENKVNWVKPRGDLV